MFHLLLIVGRVPCYPVCRLLSTFRPPGFPLYSSCCPPPPIPLGTTHNGCTAVPSLICLIFVAHDHEPSGRLVDRPVPLTPISSCSGPQRDLKVNSKHPGGVFR